MFKKKILATFLFGLVIVAGCNTEDGQKEYITTESGLQYLLEREGNGPQPVNGNIMIMNVSYISQKGNVLFSTQRGGGPMAVTFDNTLLSREGGLEEGLKMIKQGDSLLLQYPIENLIEGTLGMTFPDSLVRGSTVTVCIGLEKVLTTDEFTIYRNEQEEKRKKLALERNKSKIEADGKIIDEYLAKNNFDAQIHESGLRIRIIEEGSGELAEPQKIVRVNYTGRLLGGRLFDTSIKETAVKEGTFNPGRNYEPYQFQLGTGSVIQGWDIGIALLNPGTKAIFYVPSSLAYGERAASEVIGPNEILIFEVELVEVLE
jgi:FKBP-type peptidyl-prolyl cis-trans isomerase FkpA